MLSPLSPSRITYTSSQSPISNFSSPFSNPIHLSIHHLTSTIHPFIPSTPSSQLYPTLHITNPASKSPSPTSPIPPPSHIPAFPNSPACKYINPIHITHTYTQAHKHTSTTKPIIHYPSLIIHISHLPPHNIFPQSPKDLLIPTPISSLSPIPFITSLTTHTSLNSLFPLTFPSSLSQSPILNPQSSISNPQSPFHTNPPIPLVHQSISPLHSFTPPHSTPLQHSKTPPFKKSIQSNLVQPIIHHPPITHHPCTPERNKKEIHLSIYPPIYPFLLAQANKTKHNITYFASISISISISI